MTLAMSWDEWTAHDGVALAARVHKGDVTPAELAAQASAAVEMTHPALSAVIEVFDDAVADPVGNGTDTDGLFAGVPYLMKDLGPTLKGRLQEFGSMLMQGHRPTEDSFLATQIRKAGLNIIGRTTTPEFGVCSSVENALFVTRNPWDLDYTTCGSSAGTAAVVAAGVLPLSHAPGQRHAVVVGPFFPAHCQCHFEISFLSMFMGVCASARHSWNSFAARDGSGERRSRLTKRQT